MVAFVINKHGEPLMPCKPRKARLLLKNKKAKVISYKPFTIQLLYGSAGYKQEILIGTDLGSKHIGIAIVSEEKVLAKGEIELRQDVKTNLVTRSTYRRSRRNRNTRYRRCKFKFQTKRVFNAKGKRNKKTKKVQHYAIQSASFTSSRPKGWLPPSIQSRIDNAFFWIERFCSLVAKPVLTIEVGKFNIQKMINPDIKGVDYQHGQTYSYHDVRYFVFARDHYTCQVCKKTGKILSTHHVIYRSHGGSDRADNLITVCIDCHTFENHQPGQIFWKWMMEGKRLPSFKEGTFMNVFRKRVFNKYPYANITYGSVTTPHRKTLELEKTHFNDAIAITGIQNIKENPNEIFFIKQFRKKKRTLHEATARKGIKEKNVTSKRNEKNKNQQLGFYLNDCVEIFGKTGFIVGFNGTTMAFVKDIHDKYITNSSKSYKQVNLSECKFINHNNNWQFLSHLRLEVRESLF